VEREIGTDLGRQCRAKQVNELVLAAARPGEKVYYADLPSPFCLTFWTSLKECMLVFTNKM